MDEEIWKLHEKTGFRVSSLGRVMKFKNGEWIYCHLIVTAKKYIRVSTPKGFKPASYAVHRMMAESFLPNPYNKPEINHKNLVRGDNRLSNIEWCTGSENVKHAWDNNSRCIKGEKHPKSKLKNEDIIFIRASHFSGAKLGKMFNTSRKNIAYIKNWVTWRHVPQPEEKIVSPEVAQEANSRITAAAQDMYKALVKIIEMNMQQGIDQYGDARACESWACVKTARSALFGLPQPTIEEIEHNREALELKH